MVVGVGLVLGLGAFSLLPGKAAASGDASFGLSPSSGSYQTGATVTVSISETSSAGDDVDAVQANLSYSGNLQYDSMSLTGPFTLCGQQSGGGGSVAIGCASTSTESGTQSVATVTFTVESAGTGTVDMVSGSDIDNTSGSSVWDGSLPSAQYTLSTPSTGGGGSGSTGSGSSGSSGGTTSKSGSSSGSTSKSTASTPKSTTPTTSNASNTTGSKATTTPTGTTSTSTPTPTTSTASTTGTVTITVADSGGTPVDNAKVVIGSHTAYTNSQGKANFSGITAGSYTVQVTAAGKKPTDQKVTVLSSQANLVSMKLSSNTSLVMTIAYALLAVLVIAAAAFGIYKYIILPKRLAFSPVPVSGAVPVVGGGDIPPVIPQQQPPQETQTIHPTDPPKYQG